MLTGKLTFTPFVLGGLLLLACGDNPETQIVKKFIYDVSENKISFALEFNKDIELNTDISVPVKNYGDVKLVASDEEHGFQIGGSLNMAAFVDPDFFSIEKTRNLPNGQPMSSYVNEDVARFRVKAHEMVATSIYLGLNQDNLFLGTAIELGFVGKDFPAGLVFSQRIRDQQKRMLGVITVYGPQLDNNGNLLHPGGIFFITNVTDLVKYGKEAGTTMSSLDFKNRGLMIEDDSYITAEHRKEFSDHRKFNQLIKLFHRKAKDAGLAD